MVRRRYHPRITCQDWSNAGVPRSCSRTKPSEAADASQRPVGSKARQVTGQQSGVLILCIRLKERRFQRASLPPLSLPTHAMSRHSVLEQYLGAGRLLPRKKSRLVRLKLIRAARSSWDEYGKEATLQRAALFWS